MDISAVGNASSFASLASTPMAQLLQSQAQNAATLFGGVSGEPSDLIGFTDTAASSSLFNDPALLLQLQSWDGSPTPGSERAAPAPTTPTPVTPQFSFNPFDESSWWTPPSTGTNVDATA